MISIIAKNDAGARELSGIVTSYTLSGSYQSPARSLDFGYIASPTDKSVPAITVAAGDAVRFAVDGVQHFTGYVVSVKAKSEAGEISVRCYDGGLFLKQNAATYQFDNSTPEAAVAQICRDFGITAGNVAKTGAVLTKNYVAQKLYEIIIDAYAVASEGNGKKYCVRFDGDGQLCCFAKERGPETPVIRGGSNLMDLAYAISSEKLVNRVLIYDGQNAVIKTIEDADSIRRYGAFQSMLKDGDDAEKKARRTIDEQGRPARTVTVNNLGDIRFMTGECCIVREPFTGISGLFWIDADVHTWKNGQYYNKLTLNFRNIMDAAGDNVSVSIKFTDVVPHWDYVSHTAAYQGHGYTEAEYTGNLVRGMHHRYIKALNDFLDRYYSRSDLAGDGFTSDTEKAVMDFMTANRAITLSSPNYAGDPINIIAGDAWRTIKAVEDGWTD